ncbi:MAG: NAD(P)-dependent glycerol-3-phosphate dehydrogenase [Betaproteobacteria bacterium]|nr:NAD(P)-dependent glycerol-3-phosphate dehydrogenase [Betaproteobacteria bacterium]
MNLSVLAAGAWGTALAIAFSERHRVTLWAREDDVAQTLRETRENRRFLPGHRVPESIAIATDFQAAVASAEILIIAVPLAGLRSTARALAALDLPAAVPLLWVCKGLEAGSGKLPHTVILEELGAERSCAALSGPSFADEVAAGKPTALTLAAANLDFATATARLLHGPKLRIYASDDLPGVEVGGAVKNVLAIATGISDGLGLGDNARAALITRGLAEIARFGQACGGRRETFMGLAGVGDLILTCAGDLSRNRRVGLSLAAGKTLTQILDELGHVAEGVSTAREVAQLARARGIEMPITEAVDAVLHHGLSATAAAERLLARDPKIESA